MALFKFAIVLAYEFAEGDERLKHLGRKLYHVKEYARAILAKRGIMLAENARDLYKFGAAHILQFIAKNLATIIFGGIHTLKRVRGSWSALQTLRSKRGW